MPNYRFVCLKCNYKELKYLRISKRNNKFLCPRCKSNLQRLIDAGSSFNLKGEGFYKKGWN